MAVKQPINLDDLTIGQAKELAKLLPQPERILTERNEDYGHCIVVLDRGFVYVGHAVKQGDTLILKEGRNLRIWGTKKGLHQLVNNGPQPETKLDEAAETVWIPWRAVISLHATKEDLWSKS